MFLIFLYCFLPPPMYGTTVLFLLILSCSIYHITTSSFGSSLKVLQNAASSSSNSIRCLRQTYVASMSILPRTFCKQSICIFHRQNSHLCHNKQVCLRTARSILLICNTKKARWGHWTFHNCGYLVTSNVTPRLSAKYRVFLFLLDR